MIKGIDAIQSNNIYKVNAVQLFGNQRQAQMENNPFNSSLFGEQLNGNYNLNPPRVAGESSFQANNLDLLA